MAKTWGEVEFHEGDMVLSDDSGKGIKLGTYPNSPAFGWRDLTAPPEVRGVGANDPTWAQIGASPFYAYKFDINDQCWFSYHTPHDLVPLADIFLHAHWISDGTSVNPVKWEWTYMIARGFNQEAYSVAGTVISCTEAASGIAYQHMVTECEAISSARWSEPDAILYARLRRVTAGSPDNQNGIFLLTADVHYQSTNLTTINKAPNFYAS